MAISISTNLSKKVPIPGANYSSQQASITITAECSDPSQVVAEAQRLYALAEQAVDAQLAAKGPIVHPAPAVPVRPGPVQAQQTQPSAPARTSRPYTSAGSGTRRPPAPVTDSQLRFLDRLIRETGTDPNVILQQHQIGSLRDLSCKVAAELIDELKGTGARS